MVYMGRCGTSRGFLGPGLARKLFQLACADRCHDFACQRGYSEIHMGNTTRGTLDSKAVPLRFDEEDQDSRGEPDERL